MSGAKTPHSKAASLSEKMRRGDLMSTACPSREVLKHLTSRWGVLVLITLLTGTHRFSALRRKVGGVSERMLSERLSELAAAGLVSREVDGGPPVNVRYRLTRGIHHLPLEEIRHEPSETARRYRFSDGVGEIGIIAPVSHPFCGHCSRVRITSDGKLRTCLFSVRDHDLHELMRRGASDQQLTEFLVKVVEKKEERHHIGEPGFMPASRTMVHIGG